MFCALILPHFYLQTALRHRPTLWREPVAVLEGDAIMEQTEAARIAGVELGQTPSQGMARCMSLQLLRRSPEAEEAVSHLLLEIAMTLSARVEATAPSLCTLDLHAVPRLAFTPERLREWADKALGRLRACLLEGRAGIAPNPDLARLAAQVTNAREPIRVIHRPEHFLDPLPLIALDPEPELLAILDQWGIATLGAFRRLPRQEVALRLGPEGARLYDRATGRTHRPLRLTREKTRYEEALDFERELDTAEPLLFLLRRFVDQLTLRVSQAGLVIAEMELSLALSAGADYRHAFRVPSPTAQSDVLYRMLEMHLETLRLEKPLTGARLEVMPTRPESGQFRLFESSLRDPNRFAETLARITALAGSDRVGVPKPEGTHEPDRFVLRMPDFTRLPEKQTGETGLPRIGLPLRRFRPPLTARVELKPPGRSPAALEAGEVRGRIVALHGPYPLSGQWWETAWNREEWDAELHTGTLCRLARRRGAEPEWVIEGVYA